MNITRLILAATAIFLVSACGDDGNVGTPDGARPDAATGDTFDGTASLSVGRSAAGIQTVMGGLFVEGSDLAAVPAGCTLLREVGPCRQANVCTLTSSDDAGTLSGSVEGVEVTSSALTGGFYVGTVVGEAFAAGETVTLAATGGTVPAFSADVTAPPTPTVALPTTAARGTDLTITWGPLMADEVEVGLVAATGAVACTVAASAGTLTIDGSITADFGAGTMLVFKSVNITRVTAGAYDIAVASADGVVETVDFEAP